MVFLECCALPNNSGPGAHFRCILRPLQKVPGKIPKVALRTPFIWRRGCQENIRSIAMENAAAFMAGMQNRVATGLTSWAEGGVGVPLH